MTAPQHDHGRPDERITTLVNEFLDRCHAGETLTPEAFAVAHPEVGEPLRAALDGLSVIDQAWSRWRSSGAERITDVASELPSIPGYTLQDEIGRGGMGVVYRAEQIETRRTVALKVMLAGPFAAPAARRRFRREVQLCARLAHPHIVRVLEGGEISGQPYYAMEFVDGTRLDEHVRLEQPELRRRLELFVQICDAVEYAHQHGVIHRDLKPANVLVDAEGAPHILDFGLARAIDSSESEASAAATVSSPGQILGTLAYMAPEQAAGTPEQSDARTDVYALGLVLCEMLTGRLPYETHGRPSEVLERIVDGVPTAPSHFSGSLDVDLDTIVLKALEKKPSDRYQSVAEMAEDLRRYLAGDPIFARRRSRIYVLKKRLRKHRLASVCVVAALLAVVVLIGVRERANRVARDKARAAAVMLVEGLERSRDLSRAGTGRHLHLQHPDIPEVCLAWAREQFRSDRRDSAVRYLESRMRADPDQWAYQLLLADLYAAAGDAAQARALRTDARQRAPDTSEAWYLRSLATLDVVKALECAQRAVTLSPSESRAWERCAHLALCTEDYAGALRAADRLSALHDASPTWTCFRGHILARMERFGEAVDQYSQAIAQDGSSLGYVVFRAHAYRGLRDYARAVDDYTFVLEHSNKDNVNIWYYYQRATPLIILGRVDEALADYQRFRVLHGRPWFSDARSFILLRGLGRSDAAERVMARALEQADDPSWLRQVLLCLAGEITPDALVAEAAGRGAAEQLCEAYYYAGEASRLRGEPTAAQAMFQKCIDTGIAFDLDDFPLSPMNEYELAEWRLNADGAE